MNKVPKHYVMKEPSKKKVKPEQLSITWLKIKAKTIPPIWKFQIPPTALKSILKPIGALNNQRQKYIELLNNTFPTNRTI